MQRVGADEAACTPGDATLVHVYIIIFKKRYHIILFTLLCSLVPMQALPPPLALKGLGIYEAIYLVQKGHKCQSIKNLNNFIMLWKID